jgi:TonB family protein
MGGESEKAKGLTAEAREQARTKGFHKRSQKPRRFDEHEAAGTRKFKGCPTRLQYANRSSQHLFFGPPSYKKATMKTSCRIGTLIVLVAVFLPTNAHYLYAQANSPYMDSTQDFQRFLQDILDATKKGNKQRVASLLKSTEVPNCDAWLHQIYKSDSADSWMSLCDSKALRSNEESMKALFAGFSKEGGEFSTRKVNDNPQGGEGGLESGMVRGGKELLEVYFASWKTPNQSKDDMGEPIGYFYFLDGGFRWDSLVSFPKIKISHAKIVPPKLIKRVEPTYPADAAAQHISGTVRVYYVIGGDGAVYNAHALSGEGLSADPSLRRAAEDAVLQWRYQPATMDGKPIETNAVTVDIEVSPKS